MTTPESHHTPTAGRPFPPVDGAVEPGARVSDEVRSAHALLGETAVRFLDFAVHDREALSRSSFGILDRHDEFMRYAMQSWPTFLEGSILRQLEDASVGLFEVLKAIPQRIFAEDPERLGRFYPMDREHARLLLELSADEHHVAGRLGRGDYLLTEDGFKCLEFNASANMGGWETGVWTDRYLTTRPLQRFLAQSGLRVSCSDTPKIFFRHVLEQLEAKGLLDGPQLMACATAPSEPHRLEILDKLNELLQDALEERTGRRDATVRFCVFPQLEQRDNEIYLDGERVKVLMDQRQIHDEGKVDTHLHLFVAFMSGGVDIYNGPLSGMLGDKRNLALLSQAARSSLFDDDERRRINAYIPWTREVRRGYTDWRGEMVSMEDLFSRRRRDLVVKAGLSSQGEAVYIGAGLDTAAWDRVVREAFDAPGAFLVQEKVESLRFAYQHGEQGWCEHDLVWAAFALGPHYGGGFLRMMPRGRHVPINASGGATEGILLEVEEAPG